jgi:hypothetical protein
MKMKKKLMIKINKLSEEITNKRRKKGRKSQLQSN